MIRSIAVHMLNYCTHYYRMDVKELNAAFF